MKLSLVFVICFLAFTIEANLTKEQKRRAEQFTSIFENDTIELQYAYCEDIDDGRGFTSGRAGFCTGTGDAYEVVKKYTEKKKDNPLAKYLPELKILAQKGSPETKNLPNYCKAWSEAAKDKLFHDVQDEVVTEMYYNPAMKLADEVGLKTALSRCSFYDTIIEHGGGNGKHSIGSIIKRTKDKVGGTVKSGIDEKKWLREFLNVRYEDLKTFGHHGTEEEWKGLVERVEALIKLFDDNNMDLHGPIHVKTKHHSATIP